MSSSCPSQLLTPAARRCKIQFAPGTSMGHPGACVHCCYRAGKVANSSGLGYLLFAHLSPTSQHQVSQDLWERSSPENQHYKVSGFRNPELGRSNLDWGFRYSLGSEVKNETPTLLKFEQHHKDLSGMCFEGQSCSLGGIGDSRAVHIASSSCGNTTGPNRLCCPYLVL